MKGINTHCSIPLNINGLNFPIKRFRRADGMIKWIWWVFCLFVSFLLPKIWLMINDRHCHGVEWWENVVQESRTKKQAALDISISDRRDFKPKQFRREGKGY